MKQEQTEQFYPENRNAWRKWLRKHHASKQSVWLILYKKDANQPTITWSEAVDEALCFGWVDSTRRPVDKDKFIQFFGRRKPNSTWSKINKEKVERLINDGLMTKAGMACVEAAKQSGSWTILDKVEELHIPPDLAKAFKKHKGSKAFFMGLSKSNKKAILQWLVLAKRPETREKRITEIATLAAQHLKPKQFR